MGFIPTTIGLTEYLAKWAWNELNIPVLTAITEDDIRNRPRR